MASNMQTTNNKKKEPKIKKIKKIKKKERENDAKLRGRS
jgi:hypothetical protein